MRAGRGGGRRGVRALRHVTCAAVLTWPPRRCLATGTGPLGPTAAQPPPAAVTAQTPGPAPLLPDSVPHTLVRVLPSSASLLIRRRSPSKRQPSGVLPAWPRALALPFI